MITGRDDEFRGTINAIFNDEMNRDPTPVEMSVYLDACRNGMTGERLREIIHDYDEAKAYRDKPKAPKRPPCPSVAITGTQFDNPGRLIGTNQFWALRTFLDGGDLGPLVQESKDLGFNMWRIFGMGSKKQNQMTDLYPQHEGQYFDMVNALAVYLNANGIVPLFTCFADNQDVQLGGDHWTRVANALAGTSSLLSGGNEWNKNGWDPKSLMPPPGDIPWSRGSGVEDVPPVMPTGTFMEFHPRRLWPTVMLDTVASPVEIYKTRPPIPLIIDEPPRFGSDGSGPQYGEPFNVWRFARHYSTECAGAVFHNRAGQRGVLMDEQTRYCALAFVEGMKI